MWRGRTDIFSALEFAFGGDTICDSGVVLSGMPGRKRMTGGLWGVFLWLFFFRMRLYIVTDFVHLPWEYTDRKALRGLPAYCCVCSRGTSLGLGALFRVHHALERARSGANHCCCGDSARESGFISGDFFGGTVGTCFSILFLCFAIRYRTMVIRCGSTRWRFH